MIKVKATLQSQARGCGASRCARGQQQARGAGPCLIQAGIAKKRSEAQQESSLLSTALVPSLPAPCHPRLLSYSKTQADI